MFKWFKKFRSKNSFITAAEATKLTEEATALRNKRIEACEKYIMELLMRKIRNTAASESCIIEISLLVSNALNTHNCTDFPDARKEVIDYIASTMSQLGYVVEIDPKEGAERGKHSFLIVWNLGRNSQQRLNAEPDTQKNASEADR